MPSIQDIFSAGNEADYAPGSKNPPTSGGSGDAYDAYGRAVTSGLIQQKRAEGPYTLDEAFKDVDAGNSATENLRQADINRRADANVKLGVHQQEVNQDVVANQSKLYATRSLTPDETKEAQGYAFSWQRLNAVEQQFNQLQKTSPQSTGPYSVYGAVLNQTRFAPDDVKAFNAASAEAAGPILSQVLPYTSGADAKEGMRHEVVPQLLPQLTDTPDQFKQKMILLRTASAQQAHFFMAGRASNNAGNNPAVDISPVKDMLSDQENYYQTLQKQQQQQTTASTTPNSTRTAQTQDAYNRLAAASANGSGVNPLAVTNSPNGGTSNPAPSQPLSPYSSARQ